MFGYVKPVAGELLVKEYEFYKATYCGICRSMKEHTGFFSNVTITYDSVFLALLRMAYIPDDKLGSRMRRCAAHPMKKRCMLNDNSAIEYTARAFAILTYYKLKDDLSDEKLLRRLFVSLTGPIVSAGKKRADMSALCDIVGAKLDAITELERRRVPSVDDPAVLFGELLGEIFRFGLDGDAAIVTYRIGYFLGQFIYAADAAEDYERDKKSGAYNPYLLMYGENMSADDRMTIKRALNCYIMSIAEALDFVPFGNKITIEHIVKNTVLLGLSDRIKFLDGADTKEQDKNNAKTLKNGNKNAENTENTEQERKTND